MIGYRCFWVWHSRLLKGREGDEFKMFHSVAEWLLHCFCIEFGRGELRVLGFMMATITYIRGGSELVLSPSENYSTITFLHNLASSQALASDFVHRILLPITHHRRETYNLYIFYYPHGSREHYLLHTLCHPEPVMHLFNPITILLTSLSAGALAISAHKPSSFCGYEGPLCWGHCVGNKSVSLDTVGMDDKDCHTFKTSADFVGINYGFFKSVQGYSDAHCKQRIGFVAYPDVTPPDPIPIDLQSWPPDKGWNVEYKKVTGGKIYISKKKKENWKEIRFPREQLLRFSKIIRLC